MEYFTYILQSVDGKHWYIGSTMNIDERIKKHNSGQSKYTKLFRPWNVVYSEKFKTRSEAVKREMYFKSPKGYQEYLKIKNSIIGRIA